jgi:hypothetical protein
MLWSNAEATPFGQILFLLSQPSLSFVRQATRLAMARLWIYLFSLLAICQVGLALAPLYLPVAKTCATNGSLPFPMVKLIPFLRMHMLAFPNSLGYIVTCAFIKSSVSFMLLCCADINVIRSIVYSLCKCFGVHG